MKSFRAALAFLIFASCAPTQTTHGSLYDAIFSAAKNEPLTSSIKASQLTARFRRAKA
ncbi:hypothetical protein GCM10008019_30670 [Deinococcus soli (ex Cha et al. 2016)]|nr:hypothetical protein GCM10008019_30670 [Deinococcus soli (ex Cha et al. 2016)]